MTLEVEPLSPTDDVQAVSRDRAWRLRAIKLARDIRTDPARWASFAVVGLTSTLFALWLLFMSRHQWFVTDEFDYFNYQRDPLLAWLLQPHNEHTVVFTKAWFVLLGHFVGLRFYELYMIPLVAAHLVVVAAIYRLTWISTTSRVLASGTALASLLMGAAFSTLTWAGQFQYVGSVAAGMVVIVLAIEGSGRRTLAIAAATAAFGTLNGSAFVALGLAAALLYMRRGLWREGIMVAAIPLGWEAINHVVWAPPDIYAATGLNQILRDGPAFAYSILGPAISQTLHVKYVSALALLVLTVGTLLRVAVDLRRRHASMPGIVMAGLALAAILTILSLVVARLSLPTGSAGDGQYSYLVLVCLVPIGGILIAPVARSRVTLIGVAGVFVAVSLAGAWTFYRSADGLESWKTNGQHLMQTAAAELAAGTPTFEDQIPVPDTAPTVSQERLRALATSGQLDEAIGAPVDVDQVSLNMQWRLVPTGPTSGVCRDLAVGSSFTVPVGAPVSMIGLSPGAAAVLRYNSSGAVRQFLVPSSAVTLESVSQRTAVLTVETASVSVCTSTGG